MSTHIHIPRDVWGIIVEMIDIDTKQVIRPCNWIIVDGSYYNLTNVYKITKKKGEILLWLSGADNCERLIMSETDPQYKHITELLGISEFIK